jgi:cytosine/adenosine deaminase-related metal-dependent hydrolase
MGAYDQGHRYVANLRKAGFLLPEFLFVHGASLTDEEIAMIAEAEAGLSSTPETELQMGMGYPVALKARANGVRAGLGVDIVSNYSGDMFAQMRMMIQSVRAAANASLEAEGRAPRRVSPSAKDVLRLATLGGAEALHLEKSIGTIEVGKRADLIVIGTQSIAMTPAIDPFSAVVFNASSADVELVMVNGSLRKMKGELVGLDWPQMGGRLRRSSEAIVAKADRVDRHQIEAVVDTFFSNLAD